MTRETKSRDAARRDKPSRRLRIEKLEERIAPRRNGWAKNPNNPHYTNATCPIY